jgi:hypothetical protein
LIEKGKKVSGLHFEIPKVIFFNNVAGAEGLV